MMLSAPAPRLSSALSLAEQLARIHAPKVSMIVIERASAASARGALQDLLVEGAFQRSAIVDGASLARGLRALLADFPSVRARDVLAPDMARLARAYLEVTAERRARVQLELLRRDACRRFHYDNVPLRLLCTYAGPGTEWVDDTHVDAVALEQVELDIERANARIVPDPTRVRRANPWDVLLLKGGLYPGWSTHGAVHRSPPIHTQGLARVVLRVDSVVADDGCAVEAR